MGFPVSRDTNMYHLPYIYSGLIFNSVLFLCIVSTIGLVLIVFSFIDRINKIYGYIKKYKIIKYKLK